MVPAETVDLLFERFVAPLSFLGPNQLGWVSTEQAGLVLDVYGLNERARGDALSSEYIAATKTLLEAVKTENDATAAPAPSSPASAPAPPRSPHASRSSPPPDSPPPPRSPPLPRSSPLPDYPLPAAGQPQALEVDTFLRFCLENTSQYRAIWVEDFKNFVLLLPSAFPKWRVELNGKVQWVLTNDLPEETDFRWMLFSYEQIRGKYRFYPRAVKELQLHHLLQYINFSVDVTPRASYHEYLKAPMNYNNHRYIFYDEGGDDVAVVLDARAGLLSLITDTFQTTKQKTLEDLTPGEQEEFDIHDLASEDEE